MKSDECDEMCRIVLNRVEIGFGLNSGARRVLRARKACRGRKGHHAVERDWLWFAFHPLRARRDHPENALCCMKEISVYTRFSIWHCLGTLQLSEDRPI